MSQILSLLIKYNKLKSNLIKNFKPCVCGHDKGNMMGSWAEQMYSFPSRVSILSVKKWSINLITVQGWNSLFRIKIISFCPMSNPSSSAFVNLWNFSLGAVWCCTDDGKGQLISEHFFTVFKYPQKTQQNCLEISTLPLKKWLNQKM